MTRFIQKFGVTLPKLMAIVLVFLAGFAWAEDGTILNGIETFVNQSPMPIRIDGESDISVRIRQPIDRIN